MEPKQNESLVTNQPMSGKRLYHKPMISVYGNLADVTKATSQPATHHTDGGCWPGFNRT